MYSLGLRLKKHLPAYYPRVRREVGVILNLMTLPDKGAFFHCVNRNRIGEGAVAERMDYFQLAAQRSA